MKIEEIRAKSDAELDYELGKMEKELFDIRFRTATDSGANSAMITTLRRSIARVYTVRQERVQGIRGQEPKQ